MASNLEADIAWHQRQLLACQARIVAIESEAQGLSRTAELSVLREQQQHLAQTLEHLERLRSLMHVIVSGHAMTTGAD